MSTGACTRLSKRAQSSSIDRSTWTTLSAFCLESVEKVAFHEPLRWRSSSMSSSRSFCRSCNSSSDMSERSSSSSSSASSALPPRPRPSAEAALCPPVFPEESPRRRTVSARPTMWSFASSKKDWGRADSPGEFLRSLRSSRILYPCLAQVTLPVQQVCCVLKRCDPTCLCQRSIKFLSTSTAPAPVMRAETSCHGSRGPLFLFVTAAGRQGW
mmetsp:Transcript_10648/g.34023  ORF Transcript_10648/g.34023 Transcript_10648/m.34023 type:complete len:213 (+) Transcript_10648:150-788(+)